MHIAIFLIFSTEQKKHIRPPNLSSLRHLLNNHLEDAIHYIISFFRTSKTDNVNETHCFSTPQNPGN